MPIEASSVPNAAAGVAGSLSVRKGSAEAFRWRVRNGIIELSKTGELGRTCKEIAEQLAARGVVTARGNPVDKFKVSVALREMGVDVNAVRRWLKKSVDAADAFGVLEDDMRIQLWDEWLAHTSAEWVERGNGLDGKTRPFVPVFVRPHLYVPHHMRGVPRPHHFVAASPPVVRLAYAMFRMFELRA